MKILGILMSHWLVEFAAAAVAVLCVSQNWKSIASSGKRAWPPQRLWLACLLAIAPFILVQVMLLFGQGDIPADEYYGFSAFYGLFFGLAASSCVDPRSTGRFRTKVALGISAAFILAPPWLLSSRDSAMRALEEEFYFIACAGSRIAVAIVAWLITGGGPSHAADPSVPPPFPGVPNPNSTKAIWGLVVGLLPAAVLLLAISAGSAGWLDNFMNFHPQAITWLAFLFTVTCCLASSFMLFRRFKRGAAFAGVILLLFVNGSLVLFLGCCALLQS